MLKPLLAVVLLALISCVHGGSKAQDIKEDIEGSVYLLKSADGHGTGFVTETKKGKKVLVTNAHVCEGNFLPVMTAISHTGKKTLVRIKHISSKTDLCVLQAPKNSTPLKLSNKAHKDEQVYSVGYPLGYFMVVSEGKLKGYQLTEIPTEIPVPLCRAPKYKVKTIKIPTRDRPGPLNFKKKKICVLSINTYFLTVPTDQGFSGSPLVNDDSEVVGVIMGMQGNISWGLAIGLDELKEYLGYKSK